MAQPRYFVFQQHSNREFIFELTDEARIAEALDILSGKETSRVHVMGRIVKSKKPYNPNWDYHLDPPTISFFGMAIEVCDVNMNYVNDHLDEARGAFLLRCHWCPWDSKLVREVVGPPVA